MFGVAYPNHYEVTREAVLMPRLAQYRLALGFLWKIQEATRENFMYLTHQQRRT
jgi:hypothetical protein